MKKFFIKLKKYYFIKKLKKERFSIVDFQTNIGKYSYIGHRCGITKAVIGNYCSIANNVQIGGGEHDIKKISLNSIFYDKPRELLTKGDVIIGNDVRIGNGAIIRRGIKIGNGAIIGANSFVNKDIPPYAIAVGSPAKVIKYRFNDKAIKQIEESKRWEYEPEEAITIFKKIKTLSTF